MCKVDHSCKFSSGFAYVRPSSLSKISRDKCRDHWRRTKLQTGQKTFRKKMVPNCIQFIRGVSVDQKMTTSGLV